MAATDRYEVVLYGATGFTGKLVAKYLSTHGGAPKWAIAGRSKERLEKLRADLQLGSDVGLIEADNKRPETLASMARQAKCVMNVVGPFRLLGAEQLVIACVAEKAHYVDLSGETLLNEELVRRHHERAKEAGVAIVPSVGLDSLPTDITTYLAVQHLKEKLNAPGAQKAVAALREVAPFSSGSLLSACDMVDEDPRQMLFDDAGRLATRPPAREQRFISSMWLPQFEAYGASYLLAPHNIRTVYRTWSLLEDAGGEDTYGADFESIDTLLGGSWLSNLISANMQRLSSMLIVNIPGMTTLLRKIVPTGGGTPLSKLKELKTDMRTVAYHGDKAAICTFKAQGDPGYYLTGRMITEIALVLALDHPERHSIGKQGGVLTPATVGAEAIADRLMTYGGFEIFIKTFS